MKRWLLGLSWILLTSCLWAASNPPRIVVTLKPLHSWVAFLMQGRGSPDLILNQKTSPHHAFLTPGDLLRLKKADRVIWFGPCVETGLRVGIQSLAPEKVVTLQEESSFEWLPLREQQASHASSHVDGHIWLDPVRVEKVVVFLTQKLIEVDPYFKKGYETNLKQLKGQLQSLHKTLKTRLEPLKKFPFMVFHDAYQYLETRYGLTPKHVILSSPDALLKPKDFEGVLETLSQTPGICVFLEPQFRAPRLKAFLMSQHNKPFIGNLDPLGNGLAPGASFYFTMMDHLMRDLEACLQRP